MTARVLLTVSGVMPPDLDASVAVDRRPRVDYVEMARAFGADLVDYGEAVRTTGLVGRLVRAIGGNNLLLAWYCYRRRHDYDLVFTDGEQVGLPFGALLHMARRRPRHVMIVHILSVPKKVMLFRLLRLGSRVDRFVVYASSQRRFIVDRLNVPARHVVRTPFMVDTDFFAPRMTRRSTPPLISSAGLEFRDYPTLIDAVRDLDVRVVLAAASPWSKRHDSSGDVDLPSNVEVRRLDFRELRELYAASDLVVVPVVETDFQAGITTILEAMAMAKPIICTRTTGQTDTIVDDVNGRYVPAGDAGALRVAIETLLDDPTTAERLGTAARSWAVEHADIDVYVERLARDVHAVLAMSS